MQDAVIAFRASLRDRRGVAAAEYAILAIGVVLVVGIAVASLVDPTTGAYATFATTLASSIADMVAALRGLAGG